MTATRYTGLSYGEGPQDHLSSDQDKAEPNDAASQVSYSIYFVNFGGSAQEGVPQPNQAYVADTVEQARHAFREAGATLAGVSLPRTVPHDSRHSTTTVTFRFPAEAEARARFAAHAFRPTTKQDGSLYTPYPANTSSTASP